jgi:hypothetical protein
MKRLLPAFATAFALLVSAPVAVQAAQPVGKPACMFGNVPADVRQKLLTRPLTELGTVVNDWLAASPGDLGKMLSTCGIADGNQNAAGEAFIGYAMQQNAVHNLSGVWTAEQMDKAFKATPPADLALLNGMLGTKEQSAEQTAAVSRFRDRVGRKTVTPAQDDLLFRYLLARLIVLRSEPKL